MGFPGGAVVKNLPANAEDTRHGSESRVPKIPWGRKRHCEPTPVFLSGEPLGQRSLAGHSPRVHKELDVTEHTQMDAKDLGKIALIVF